MWPDAKESYSYNLNVESFPRIACAQILFLLYQGNSPTLTVFQRTAIDRSYFLSVNLITVKVVEPSCYHLPKKSDTADLSPDSSPSSSLILKK